MKDKITQDMKTAMKAKDKERLGVIRMILSAIKQVEVDTREVLGDSQITSILNKMIKQRKESAKQYEEAGRQDLLDQENFEIDVIQEYLPQALTEPEIDSLIDDVISTTEASGPQDMGKVMGLLKDKVAGRADMGQLSQKVKSRLAS